MPALTVNDVQEFLRDHSENNILLDQIENPESLIEKAIQFTVELWNSTPPATNDSSVRIPRPVLLYGVTAWLLRSSSLLQARNQATVRDGMLSPIGIDDKAQLYLSMAGNFQAQFDAMTQSIKINRNCSGAFGQFGSGFSAPFKSK